MRRFRSLFTAILGLLIVIDAIMGYRLWESGGPKYIGLTSPRAGVEQIQVIAVPFTGQDWIILILLISVHALLCCLVWKAWRSDPVRL